MLLQTKKIVPLLKFLTTSAKWDKITLLDESKLTGRFLLYLNGDIQHLIPKLGSTTLLTTNRNEVPHKLPPISNEYAKYEKNLLGLNVRNTFGKKRLSEIDTDLSLHAAEMDPINLINFLHIYMQFIPNRITEQRFFIAALKKLERVIDTLSSKDLIQLLFYTSLQKKKNNSKKLIKRCLYHLRTDVNNLSVENLCIICYSTFKTSTKISSIGLLTNIIMALNENLCLLNDGALFTTLVKTLRHNRCQNDDILNTISCTILFNKSYENYNFCGMCHILALYADYSYYDENILNLFFNRCIKILTSTRDIKLKVPDIYIRLKDIVRFLWCYSILNYKIDSHIFQDVVIPHIIKNIHLERKNSILLFDAILYMWIMGYQAVELFPYCFTKENVQLVKDTQSKSRDRLNLLLTCIQLENKEAFKSLNFRYTQVYNEPVKGQLNLRPCLKRVYDVLNNLRTMKYQSANELKFKAEAQIPHLNLTGITGYKKDIYKSVFIEVLDGVVCLKNRFGEPNGLMKLKLRLLDTMKEGLITVSNDEIKEMTDEELTDFLLSEIKMVC